MALTKVTYTDNVTVIGADNLNDIQDEIIRLDADKADLDSPALTGTPTAPTPTEGDSSTKIATTEFVADLVCEAAQVDGNYPDMSVGGVISSTYTEDSDPYTYRKSPAGGVEVDEIVGGTVAWNQLVQNGDFSNGTTGWSGNLGTISVSNNKCTFTVTESNATNALHGLENGISGHVHIMSMDVTTSKATSCSAWLSGTRANNNVSVPANTKTNVCVLVIPTMGSGGSYFYCNRNLNMAVGDTCIYENVFTSDLTLALGSTIADYVYSLETATAGAGVTWLKTHFPKMFGQYNAYDAGSIKSVEGVSAHKMRGANLAGKATTLPSNGVTATVSEDGTITLNGTATAVTHVRGAYDCPNPSATYTWAVFNDVSWSTGVEFSVRRANTNLAGGWSKVDVVNKAYTFTPEAVPTMWQIQINSGTTFNNATIKPMIVWGSNAPTAYEPYETWSYPLDSSLTLRGIPKLDSSNNLYYDGDTYASDGTVTRKYGIVDLGTLTWTYQSSTSMFYSGAYNAMKSNTTNGIVSNGYILVSSTLTVQSTDKSIAKDSNGRMYIKDSSYTTSASFQTAMSGVYLVYELATPTTESATPYQNPQRVGSTEEYVTDSIVPVGHNSKYYDSFTVPKAPSTDGTYTLKVTVSGGFPSYTWEATE